MESDTQANAFVAAMVDEIKRRYEIQTLQGLRNREKSLHENLAQLRDVLKSSNLEMNKQQVLLDQESLALKALEEKRSDVAHEITTA